AWQDNASSEVGFRVERSDPGTSSFFSVDTVPANISSFEDALLSPQTTYQYRVYAYNEFGNSSYSSIVSVTPGTSVIPPGAPSNLSATTVSATQIALSWVDNTASENGFRLERAFTGSNSYAIIASLSKGTTTYRDKNLQPSTNYTYRVQAFNNVGLSSFSNLASAITDELTGAPNPPSALQAAAKSSTQIWIDWIDNAVNEDGFYIERAPGGTSDWEVIQTVLANVASYRVVGLNSATTYSFRVRAFNQVDVSAYSNIITRTTPPLSGSPSPPSTLQLAEPGATKLKIKWKDNSGNEDGFYIERSPAGGAQNFIQIASTGVNEIEYEDKEVQPSTGYSYRVRSFNLRGISNPSYPITITTKGQTETRFINGSSHSIISLVIDGTQYFSSPQEIPSSSYLPILVSAGRHTYSMKNGYWSGLLPVILYSDTGQFIQQQDVSGSVSFTDPTIFQILTKFRYSAKWQAKYNAGADSMAFRFLSDGTFYFYNTLGQRTSGLYNLKQRNSTTIYFTADGFEGTYIEDPSANTYFTMPNGPPSEQVLRYYFQENQ
ncbi:MAG: fibronectin type III domain-containing protein, partial [Bacteroidetes bacterium]